MRIWAFSDVHDNELFLEALEKALKMERPDAIIFSGDISRKKGFAEDLCNIIKHIKTFYVPGNYDTLTVEHVFEECGMNINAQLEKFNNFNIIGIGYTHHIKDETHFEKTFKSLFDPDSINRIILITHIPPYSILDRVGKKHVGSRALLKIIKKYQPFLSVFGHVHEVVGIKMIKSTIAINIPPGNELMGCKIIVNNNNNLEFRLMNLNEILI